MHLVPTQDEVVGLLRRTGAIRDGHFEYPNGLHATEYLQVQLAMRYFQHAKVLSVGLSRLLRANAEIRAMIPELSIVSPDTGGLPVAYGVCEALRAHQVYWADRGKSAVPCAFASFWNRSRARKCCWWTTFCAPAGIWAELKRLVESTGGEVVGMAVIIYQPTPKTVDFSPLPLYYLAKLDATYYKDAGSCEMCKRGVPAEKVWI